MCGLDGTLTDRLYLRNILSHMIIYDNMRDKYGFSNTTKYDKNIKNMNS